MSNMEPGTDEPDTVPPLPKVKVTKIEEVKNEKKGFVICGPGRFKVYWFIWLSLVMLCFTFALHVAAMSTINWAVNGKTKVKHGLWKYCDVTGCDKVENTPYLDFGDKGRTTQTFSCFVLVGMIAAFVLTILYMIKPNIRRLWIILLATRWVILLFLSLMLIVWSSFVGVREPHGFSLGTSFGLDVFAFILELVGALSLLSLLRVHSEEYYRSN